VSRLDNAVQMGQGSYMQDAHNGKPVNSDPLVSTDDFPGDPSQAELAEAVRQLIDITVRPQQDPAEYHRLLTLIQSALSNLTGLLQDEPSNGVALTEEATLVSHTPTGGQPGEQRGNGRTRNPLDYVPLSPIMGTCNPLAPPVKATILSNGEITGTVWMGSAYQGPPGCVHGGVIAAIFDELLGLANFATMTPAMTGTLKIRYRKPTPLWKTLDVSAKVTEKGSKKNIAIGTISCDGELTAQAEGIFIALSPDRLKELSASAGQRESQRPMQKDTH
jgi:acyl-coenzyme A thioesterase PaaI-like protein